MHHCNPFIKFIAKSIKLGCQRSLCIFSLTTRVYASFASGLLPTLTWYQSKGALDPRLRKEWEAEESRQRSLESLTVKQSKKRRSGAKLEITAYVQAKQRSSN